MIILGSRKTKPYIPKVAQNFWGLAPQIPSLLKNIPHPKRPKTPKSQTRRPSTRKFSQTLHPETFSTRSPRP